MKKVLKWKSYALIVFLILSDLLWLVQAVLIQLERQELEKWFEYFWQQPDSVDIYLYESFAKTYRGHGTDIALVGGLLGMEPDDEQLANSLEIAYEQGMEVCFIPKVKKQTTLIPLKLWFLLATENYLWQEFQLVVETFKFLN